MSSYNDLPTIQNENVLIGPVEICSFTNYNIEYKYILEKLQNSDTDQ